MTGHRFLGDDPIAADFQAVGRNAKALFTLKVHRGIKLAEMEPGDDVAIRTTRVIDVRPGSR